MRRNALVAFIAGLLSVGMSTLSWAQQKGRTELGIQDGGILIERDSNLKDSWLLGGRIGHYLTNQLELSASILTGETDIKGSNKNADIFLPMLELEYDFSPKALKPYLALGAGVMNTNLDGVSDGNNTDFAASYGAGIKWLFDKNFTFRLDARHLFNADSGIGTNNAIVQAGLSWLIGKPEPLSDKGNKVIIVEKTPLDSDGDGVYDDKDECPNTPHDTPVDARGCGLDSDKDGVTDDKDKCPNTPEKALVDADGCPLDGDNDGVADGIDECPNTPKGTQVSKNGCPLAVKEVPQERWILKGVNFEVNSDKLLPQSTRTLSEVAETLVNYTKVRVEIQGHTDSQGSEAYNQALSERRAATVKRFLISKGVDDGRMETKGYGEAFPLGSNDTSTGRAANRRIEFKVLTR